MRIASFLLLFLPFYLNGQDESDCDFYDHNLAPKEKIAFSVKTLSADDYRWIDGPAKGKKVVLIGESHWMNTLHAYTAGLVFYLAQQGFRTLVLEMPYSTTAYINAYINGDDAEGEKLMTYLRVFFDAKENQGFLNQLRDWNRQHPDKKITVACSDVEQDISFALKHVFVPFFNQIGDTGFIPKVRAAGTITPEILAYMDSLIKVAPADTRLTDRPFIDKVFVQHVFENFKAFYYGFMKIEEQGEEKGFPLFMEARVAQILRNLTEDAFFGSLMKNTKSIVWGGAAHTRIYQPEGTDFPHYEGWKLAHEVPFTKGQVLSIKLVNYGFNVPASCYANQAYQNGADQFASLVEAYKSCVNSYSSNRFLLIDDPTEMTRVVFTKFKKNSDRPVIFKGRTSMQKIGKKNPAMKMDEVWQDYYGFDYILAFPCATLFEYEE